MERDMSKDQSFPLEKIIEDVTPNIFKLSPKALTLLSAPYDEIYEKYKNNPKSNFDSLNFNPSSEKIISRSRIKQAGPEDKKFLKKIKNLLPLSLVEILEEEGPYDIGNEVLGNIINISGFLPIQEIANEFKGNFEIRNIIMELGKEKPLFRRIRGDGNGFFRAVIILYFEKLLADDIQLDKKMIAKSRIITFVKEILKGKLIKCNSGTNNLDFKVALEDTDALKEVLQRNVCEILLEKFFLEVKLGDKALAYRELLKFIEEKINNVKGFDLALIVFMRSWILKFYNEHFEEYKHFIYDNSAETILRTYGSEAENVIIPIVADILDCSVTIDMIHKNQGATELNQVTYNGFLESKKGNKDININLYFMPGHYDCIYDRSFYTKYFNSVFENI